MLLARALKADSSRLPTPKNHVGLCTSFMYRIVFTLEENKWFRGNCWHDCDPWVSGFLSCPSSNHNHQQRVHCTNVVVANFIRWICSRKMGSKPNHTKTCISWWNETRNNQEAKGESSIVDTVRHILYLAQDEWRARPRNASVAGTGHFIMTWVSDGLTKMNHQSFCAGCPIHLSDRR